MRFTLAYADLRFPSYATGRGIFSVILLSQRLEYGYPVEINYFSENLYSFYQHSNDDGVME